MKRHEYSHILEAIAKGMEVQIWTSTGEWESIHDNDALARVLEGFEPSFLRAKPKTIRIGEYEVPEPIREVGVSGNCYLLDLTRLEPQNAFETGALNYQYLENGLIFKTKEDAMKAREAILSLLKKETK